MSFIVGTLSSPLRKCAALVCLMLVCALGQAQDLTALYRIKGVTGKHFDRSMVERGYGLSVSGDVQVDVSQLDRSLQLFIGKMRESDILVAENSGSIDKLDKGVHQVVEKMRLEQVLSTRRNNNDVKVWKGMNGETPLLILAVADRRTMACFVLRGTPNFDELDVELEIM